MRIPLDPAMQQYILDAVASVDEIVVKKFYPWERKILQNIHTASLEEGLHILGRVGKRYMIVVGDRKKISENPPNIKAILRWFRGKVFKLVGPALKDWGLFVRADKEIVQALSLLSLEITPQTMFLLRNYEEISQHIANVSDVYIKNQVEKQSQILVDQLLCEAFALQYRFRHRSEQDKYKLRPEQIPILFYFSANREARLSALMIAMHLGTSEIFWRLRKHLDDMVKVGYIQQWEVEEGEYFYQLTAYGVYLVNQLRDRITYHT